MLLDSVDGFSFSTRRRSEEHATEDGIHWTNQPAGHPGPERLRSVREDDAWLCLAQTSKGSTTSTRSPVVQDSNGEQRASSYTPEDQAPSTVAGASTPMTSEHDEAPLLRDKQTVLLSPKLDKKPHHQHSLGRGICNSANRSAVW